MVSQTDEKTVEDYGLEVGEKVKFHRSANQDWSYGTVRGIERDGSIGLTDDYSGGARAIMPNLIEKRIRGPRGGIKWVPLVD